MKTAVALGVLFVLLEACSTPEEQALANQQKGIELFQQGQYQEAELALKNAVQLNKDDSAEAYYYLGLLNERNQQYQSMRTNLRQAVQLQENHAQARLKLAKVSLLLNDIDAAKAEVDYLLAKDAENLDALTLRAAVLINQGQEAKGHDILEAVLAKQPIHSEALSLKAGLLMRTKDYDQALALIAPALQEQNDDLSLRLLEIQLYTQKRDLQALEHRYRQLVEKYPKRDDFRYGLIRLLVVAGKKSDAKDILLNLVQDQPDQLQPKLTLLEFYRQFEPNQLKPETQDMLDRARSQPDILLGIAHWYWQVGMLAVAENQIKDIVDKPDFSEETIEQARLDLIRIALQQNRIEEARILVQSLLNDNPNLIPGKILKSRIFLVQNDLESARELLTKVLFEQPNSDEAMVLMAQIHQLQGRFSEAEKQFKEVLMFRPSNVEAALAVSDFATEKGQVEYASEVLVKALAYQPTELKLLKKLVQVEMARQNWTEAEVLAKRIERLPGQSLLGEFLLAKVYQEQSDCARASEMYEKILTHVPGQTDSMRGLANCRIRLGQEQKINAYLDSRLSDPKSRISALIVKTDLLSHQNKIDKAIEFLFRNAGEKPWPPEIYAQLGMLQERMGDLSKAAETYQEALSFYPTQLKFSLTLANILTKLGNIDPAIAIYRQVLEKSPNLDIARNNLASLLLDEIGSVEAVNEARALVATFAESRIPFFRDTHAWALFKSGEALLANEQLKRIVVQHPDVPIFRYHLASTEQALGNSAQALAEVREALQLAKDKEFSHLSKAEQLLQQLQIR